MMITRLSAMFMMLMLMLANSAIAETVMDKFERYYTSALDVDAQNVQISLMEASLYNGPIDGQWGPETEEAFINALDWMTSRAGTVNIDNEADFFNFVASVRATLFDTDSGLTRRPTGEEFALVAASSRSQQEADRLVRKLDQELTATGYPNRAQIFVTTTGILAVSGGLYSRNGCEEKLKSFKAAGLIPLDSYCAGINRFDPMQWTD